MEESTPHEQPLVPKVKHNIIVYGLLPHSKEVQDLKDEAGLLFKSALGIKPVINNITKLKGNMCIVELKKFQDKVHILNNKHKLRAHNRVVYIYQEETRQDRKPVYEKISDRYDEELEKGVDVVRGHNYLIINGTKWMWDSYMGELVEVMNHWNRWVTLVEHYFVAKGISNDVCRKRGGFGEETETEQHHNCCGLHTRHPQQPTKRGGKQSDGKGTKLAARNSRRHESIS